MSNLTVKVWGAGGSGGNHVNSGSRKASGGGGGAFAESVLTPEVKEYTVTVGSGGGGVSGQNNGNNGGSSWFDTDTTVFAEGGKGGKHVNAGQAVTGGAGGSTGNSIGDTKYNGGRGGNSTGDSRTGTGGGGGAGDSGDGSNGQDGTGGTSGGAGGSNDGGNGGNGAIGGGAGGGSTIGGGAGGATNAGSTNPSGARGEIRILYPTGTIVATGGSITTEGGNTIHTFTSTGTFEITSIVNPPTVTTQAVSDILAESAVGNGNVTEDEGETIVERGFVYDTSSHSNPGNVSPAGSDYPDVQNESGSFGEGAFDLTISSLEVTTTYYVRAYAENASGSFAYGDEVEFTTLDYKIEGVVSLSGTPVEGATVRCIRESDNTTLTEQTTDGSGEYSFEALDVEETYHIAVEYEDGESTKYNALSLWDITPVAL